MKREMTMRQSKTVQFNKKMIILFLSCYTDILWVNWKIYIIYFMLFIVIVTLRNFSWCYLIIPSLASRHEHMMRKHDLIGYQMWQTVT